MPIGELIEELKSIIDDSLETHASMDKLRECGIGMVYPGHGAPFWMSSMDLVREDNGWLWRERSALCQSYDELRIKLPRPTHGGRCPAHRAFLEC